MVHARQCTRVLPMGLSPLLGGNGDLGRTRTLASGQMGFTGNKVADILADLEAHNPHTPSHLAMKPSYRTTDGCEGFDVYRPAGMVAKRKPKLQTWCSR